MRMRKRPDTTRGFAALLLVFAMAASMAVMLYLEMPRVMFEGQREKEEQLIQRGEQYKRAIQIFVRKNKRYPATIEELEKFQDTRFLRRRYKDPLTGKDEWRLIHHENGGFPDSLVYKQKDPLEKEKSKDATLVAEIPFNSQASTQPGAVAPGLARRSSDRPAAAAGMPQNYAAQPGDPDAPPPPPPLEGDPNDPARLAAAQQMQQMQPGDPNQPQYVPGQVPTGQMVPGQMPTGQMIPGQMPTGQMIPGQMPAGQMIPGQVNPGQVIPGQGMPGQGMPGQGMPGQVMPGQVMPGQVMAGQPAPFPIVPGQPNPFQQGFQQQQLQQQAQQQLAQQQAQQSSQAFIGGGQTTFIGGAVTPQQPSPFQPQYQQYVQPGQYQPGMPQPGMMPQTGMPQPYVPNAPGPPPFGAPGSRGPVSSQAGGAYPMPVAGNPAARPGAPGSNQAIDLIRKILTTPRPGGMPGAAAAPSFVLGSGIAGVASKIDAEGIKIYAERTNYKEWEFIYDQSQDKSAQLSAQGQAQAGQGLQGPGQGQGQPRPGQGQVNPSGAAGFGGFGGAIGPGQPGQQPVQPPTQSQPGTTPFIGGSIPAPAPTPGRKQ